MPLTTLKYDGTCALCRSPLPAGLRAFFDPGSRDVTCARHHTDPPAEPGPGRGRRPISARSFAEQKADRYRERVRRTWGPLAPLVLLLRPDDAGVRAAVKGAAGEERLGARLDKLAARSGGAIVVLHDRRIPGRRENLDHVVVCPSGVWAVDAKAYTGPVGTGGLVGGRLRLGRRDGSKLIEQVQRQMRFLGASLGPLGLPALPVDGAVCFVDAQVGWWSNGRRVGGVAVVTPRRLARLLTEDGPLTAAQVQWAAERLHSWFTPQ